MKRVFLIAGLTFALIAATPFQAFAGPNDDNASTGLTAASHMAVLTGDDSGSLNSHATKSKMTSKTVNGTYEDSAIQQVKTKKAKYKDAYFTKNSTKVQKNLAKLSMLASATAYGSGKTKKDRSRYSIDLLEQCGFVDYTANGKPVYKYAAPKINNNDCVSYAIGAKKINDFTVIAVWVKGSGGDYEWVSNFNIGKGETHKGFARAEKKLFKGVESFMEKNGITGNVKWWITGHSRGGAVANLFAKRQTDTYGKENVYAYTFGSPRVSTAAKKTGYESIVNYLNPGDFITEIPPAKWGYGRYGKDVTFSSKTLSSMKAKFKKISGIPYSGYKQAEKQSLVDTISDYVNGEDVSAYYEKNPLTGIAPVTFFKEGIGYYLAGNNSGFVTAAGIAAIDPKAGKVLTKLLTDGNGVTSNKIHHAHCQLGYLCWLDAMYG